MLQFHLLLTVALEQLVDERVLGANKKRHKDSDTHAAVVPHLRVSEGFFVLSLADVGADHSRDGVGEAEREYEGER